MNLPFVLLKWAVDAIIGFLAFLVIYNALYYDLRRRRLNQWAKTDLRWRRHYYQGIHGYCGKCGAPSRRGLVWISLCEMCDDIEL